jgi:ubiquinone/menaquinone biosynthesis C-methylase UbiE
MTRVEIQDKMLTTGMGGVLSELSDPTQLHRVLDVGCGTGWWLMETARTYPTIEQLVGVDISSKMLTRARAQAEDQQLGGRVQFKTMDALRILQFPANSFDLVNQRMGASWLRNWEWKKILLEYQRVTRPGGIMRITESDFPQSNSPATTKINEICLKAFHNSGRYFTDRVDGLTSELARLMTQHAVQDVQTRVHTLTIRAGTPECQQFSENAVLGSRTILPFLQQWTRVPSDYLQICQQALKEIQEPDFTATWTLVTAWGTKPLYGDPLLMRGLK